MTAGVVMLGLNAPLLLLEVGHVGHIPGLQHISSKRLCHDQHNVLALCQLWKSCLVGVANGDLSLLKGLVEQVFA